MANREFPTAQEIELRAYELCIERGGIDGPDGNDWLAAEKEFTQLPGQYPTTTPTASHATPGQ